MIAKPDLNRNNLDCLRLLLALIVVLFHVHQLTNIPEFSVFTTYLSPHFAVRSFFVISGLLIYRSYTRSSSISSYFEKRFRRIYPGYFAVVFLSAVALWPLSTLPGLHYFGFGFWKYLGANLLFLHFLAPCLPGVFNSNSIAVVNGSLWTLRIEVAFYLLVPVLHALCVRFGSKIILGAAFFLSCAWKFGFAFLNEIHQSHAVHTANSSEGMYEMMGNQFPSQLIYFLAGILLFLNFDWLKEHLGAITCITACFYLVDHWLTQGYLDAVWISGTVLIAGFWIYIGNFSKYGDFSYGVYIVHWPIIQAMVAVGLLKLSPPAFLMLSLTLVGVTSILLWHLVESRFLKTSSHYLQR